MAQEREVYLDNSATTQVCSQAAQRAFELMTECYGNPSSLHSKGLEAERHLRAFRETVAKSIKATAQEIYFTSGGTESNNLAVLGAADAHRRSGKRIVTTELEHSSVRSSCDYLESQGFEVVRIKPNSHGEIDAEKILEAVNDDTILVSIMLVNNEVGSILPVSQVFSSIKRRAKKPLLHCDAVQAFGKMPISVSQLGCDMLTISAHKIHGPKGVGALYLRRGTRINPRQLGGQQEDKIRPGTQAVPLIGAFAAAVENLPDYDTQTQYVRTLNDYLRQGLSQIEAVTINSPDNGLPFILNFSTNRVRSEIMLHHLAQSGIYCSSGSACSKGQPSHVLSAMGLNHAQADSALRISFSRHNTTEDIDLLLAALSDGIARRGRFGM